MRKLSTFVDCLLITAVAVAAPTANEDFVVAEDAKTYTNAVNAANAYTDGKIAEIPAPDFSTNNTELVETIEAKAPTPDLSPFLRNDKPDSDVQIFGGLLSGFGFHADTGHNDNGWSQYTAHNGTALSQSLPTYIGSNPWNFLKQGEAIPTTGGVFNAYIHLNQKFSVGTWTQSVKPIESVGGSGIAFAFGDNVQTRAANTMVLGVGALNTNAWSFIWNGDSTRMYFPTIPNQSNPYATRHNGGFHVNPSVRSGMANPLQNFWIGDTNLNDWISALAPTPTWDTLSGKPTFATVATSGAYSDLSGRPSIPTTAADVGAVSLNGGRMNLGASLSFGPQGDGVDIYSGGIELSDTDDGHTESLFIDYNSITFTKRGESTVYHFPLAASEIGAYTTGEVDSILEDYLPLDYFKDGQTIPMFLGDGTKLCDFGANWLGNLVSEVDGKPDAADIPPAVSNIVTAAYINDRVNVTPLAGRTYDFATNIGLYTAVRDIIQALGGSVTNFPAIPQN